MYTSIQCLKINYETFGTGESILLLHGWGGSIASLKPMGQHLAKKGYQVYLVDLPGFGKSDTPHAALTLNGYAEIIETFLQQMKNDAWYVFGHSFGGSIGMKLAIRNTVSIKKLILCNSAGIRKRLRVLGIERKIFGFLGNVFQLPGLRIMYPYIRKLFYYYVLQQRDYIDHQELRETFKKVINEDVTSQLKHITVPTLLLWGEDDTSTPLAHANVIHTHIPQSKLEQIPLASHNLPLKKPELVAQKTHAFIKSEK